MEYDYWQMASRLLLALLAGGIIGLERSIHGREAGFRTHTLVCVSSSLLMVLMVYQWVLIPEQYLDTVRVDPSRMAQGIMTGIGFLGAGVILKEGLTVRGLTTSASIWMTAAIGIVIGMGLFAPALIAILLTLLILAAFRLVEKRLPATRYARLRIRFDRSTQMNSEDSLRKLMAKYNINGFEPGYHLDAGGAYFEYEMTMSTRDVRNFRRLAQNLLEMRDVFEFRIDPFN